MKIIGILLACFIVFLEYSFANWLQGAVNSVIPHNEWYGLIHIATLIAHICFLGAFYVWVLLFALGIFGISIKS